MCKVYFDLIDTGYTTWWLPAVGIGIFVLAGGIYMALGLPPFATAAKTRRSMFGSAIFGLVFSFATAVLTYADYYQVKEKYEHGKYYEIEGKIENFVGSGPNLQPGTERFSVGPVAFYHSMYSETPGFRGKLSSGRKLYNGLRVRIRYIGNIIVRLEACPHT